MPIYEYACDSCQFRFEVRQRFDEEPVALCPKCKGKVRRVFHAVPWIPYTDGFYKTDKSGETIKLNPEKSTRQRRKR